MARAFLAFLMAVAFYAGVASTQASSAHGVPTMTPNAAPVPRAAPVGETVRANATPSPKPAHGP